MTVDAIVALLGVGIFAVVGHGMVMWYKMGKLEANIEMICKYIFDGENHVA